MLEGHSAQKILAMAKEVGVPTEYHVGTYHGERNILPHLPSTNYARLIWPILYVGR